MTASIPTAPGCIQIVGVALEPDRRRNAETVLDHIEPINQRHGFMAKVDLESYPSTTGAWSKPC